MAASLQLGGNGGINIVGLGNGSPIIGGGVPISNNGSMGTLTPSHGGIKYCASGIGGSGASSVHSPASTPSSTPNSTGTINSMNNGSIAKCPGSNNSMSGSIGNSNSENINNNNPNSTDAFGSKCKRKINFSNLGMPARAHQPATVAKRNARERNRVKQVNNGFAALKQHIPPGVRSKKMSKVETLRCAVDYIKSLQGMLNIHGSFAAASPAGSSTSGDFILMDDDDEMEDQKPSIAQLQQAHHHHQQQQLQEQQQQQQLNGVSNQRDAFALSSSSSPTTSVFGAVAAHLPHHLVSLHSHQQHQQLANNNTNPLRQNMSSSHHLYQNHPHAANGVNVAAALLAENGSSTVTPNSNQLSPTSSDDPSSPSYASEASSYVNSAGNIKGNGMYDYENYEPVSPEDEELLDAIAFWQQS